MPEIVTVELDVGKDARFGRSIPDYPHRRSGTALVVGTGPKFMEEYEEASRLRPGAFLMVVNNAAGFLRGDGIFSIHHERIHLFVRDHDLRWGQREMRPETHSCCRDREAIIAWTQAQWGKWVDYFWPIANSWGSSGWAAGKCCRAMGFDEVILCGVPLAQTGQIGTEWIMPKSVKMYREGMAKEAELEPEIASGIKSMSGYTREILGAPEGVA